MNQTASIFPSTKTPPAEMKKTDFVSIELTDKLKAKNIVQVNYSIYCFLLNIFVII